MLWAQPPRPVRSSLAVSEQGTCASPRSLRGNTPRESVHLLLLGVNRAHGVRGYPGSQIPELHLGD